MQEIEDIKAHGVPQRTGSGGERVQSSRTVQGIVLPEESVEAAVRTVEASVQGTVQAIALIDKCMAALSSDPYYKILEMRYFEGRTQEDIAVEFKCTQQNIAYHKRRLVNELAIKMFPDKVIDEYLN
jgi:DNA-directed RNA polymerase specialized sigma24 family protein